MTRHEHVATSDRVDHHPKDTTPDSRHLLAAFHDKDALKTIRSIHTSERKDSGIHSTQIQYHSTDSRQSQSGQTREETGADRSSQIIRKPPESRYEPPRPPRLESPPPTEEEKQFGDSLVKAAKDEDYGQVERLLSSTDPRLVISAIPYVFRRRDELGAPDMAFSSTHELTGVVSIQDKSGELHNFAFGK